MYFLLLVCFLVSQGTNEQSSTAELFTLTCCLVASHKRIQIHIKWAYIHSLLNVFMLMWYLQCLANMCTHTAFSNSMFASWSQFREECQTRHNPPDVCPFLNSKIQAWDFFFVMGTPCGHSGSCGMIPSLLSKWQLHLEHYSALWNNKQSDSLSIAVNVEKWNSSVSLNLLCSLFTCLWLRLCH